MAYSAETVRVARQTLQRLRQIRGAVLAENPLVFDGNARRDAERLVAGLAELLRTGVTDTSIAPQQELLADTKNFENSVPAGVSWTRLNLVLENAESMNDWQRIGRGAWQCLIYMNGLEALNPCEDDVVIAPLSAGAISAGVAAAIADVATNLELAVVDTTKFYDVHIRKTPRQVYLPPKPETSNRSRFLVLDNTVMSGLTVDAVARAIEVVWQVDPAKIIRYR